MENVIVIPVPSVKAGRVVLESLDDLADADSIDLRAGAVVERFEDGRWRFPEETENISYRGTLTAGALGAMIGLLAGPAGLLLGGTLGLVVGSSVEVGDAEDAEAVVLALPRLIPPGSEAVICDVYETDPVAVDNMLGAHGVTSWRMSRAEAEAQLSEARNRQDV